MPVERKHIEAILAAWVNFTLPGAGSKDDEHRVDHALSIALAACDESPWRGMDSAPSEGETFLAAVDGVVRKVAWTKTSHVPLWGWCLVDQGVEDRDFCEPSLWMPMPAAPEVKL